MLTAIEAAPRRFSKATPAGAKRRPLTRRSAFSNGLTGRLGVVCICLVVLLTALAGEPAAARPTKILVLGDSLSAGYGLPHQDGFEQQLTRALATAGYPVTISDAAVSGDTSAGGRARLDWALGDAPDCAIVELGANDGLRGNDVGQMQANLTAILDTLAAHHLPTLLTGMLAPPNLGRAYTNSFRDVFTRLGERPGLLYYPFFLEGVAADHRLIQADGLHPNAEGVRRIVARLLPLVERLIARVPGAEITKVSQPANRVQG